MAFPDDLETSLYLDETDCSRLQDAVGRGDSALAPDLLKTAIGQQLSLLEPFVETFVNPGGSLHFVQGSAVAGEVDFDFSTLTGVFHGTFLEALNLGCSDLSREFSSRFQLPFRITSDRRRIVFRLQPNPPERDTVEEF